MHRDLYGAKSVVMTIDMLKLQIILLYAVRMHARTHRRTHARTHAHTHKHTHTHTHSYVRT